MERKNRALKGLMTLGIVLALCMFFSRTVQTITTPKIQRITATKGKLEQKIPLTGTIYFQSSEQIKINDARKLSIIVDQVMVRPGYYVNAGDVIFTAYSAEYEDKLEEMQDKYDEKVQEYADELAAHLRLRQESDQNDMYNEMVDKIETYYTVRYQLAAQAEEEGYKLPSDPALWTEIHDGSEALNALSVQLKAAQDEQDAAIAELTLVYEGKSLKTYRIADSTFEYIKKKEKLRGEIDKLAQEMREFEQLHASLLSITAPHSGYITEVGVKNGDMYDGSKAAYAITQEDVLPVLRVDITTVDKTIREGTKAVLTDTNTESKVSGTETAADGKKYALIELTSKVMKSAGGLTQLVADENVPITLTYKAQKSTTLLPASAVRSDGSGGYYVYIVNQNYGGLLTGGGYTVSKQTVSVVEKSDQIVALSDDLSYREIADREDRALTDGQAVMDYVD